MHREMSDGKIREELDEVGRNVERIYEDHGWHVGTRGKDEEQQGSAVGRRGLDNSRST